MAFISFIAVDFLELCLVWGHGLQMSYMQLTFVSGQRYANNPLLGLNAIFKRLDQNHSGKVDHNEFLQLCSILDFNGSVDLMNALFNRYDLDRQIGHSPKECVFRFFNGFFFSILFFLELTVTLG